MASFVKNQLGSAGFGAGWLVACMAIGLLSGSAGAHLALNAGHNAELTEARRSLMQLGYLTDPVLSAPGVADEAVSEGGSDGVMQVAARPEAVEPSPPGDWADRAAAEETAALSAELAALMARARVILAELQGRAGEGQVVLAEAAAEETAVRAATASGEPDVLVQLADRPDERARLVRRVQSRLVALGFDPGPVDGIYGPRTAAAVTAFREAAGLGSNGQITLATLDALENGQAEQEAPLADDQGQDDDEQVRTAQSLLAELGFDPGPADGIAGPRTAAAVRDFQAAAGLETDGQVSDVLIAQLLAVRELELDESAPDTPVATSGEEIDEEEITRALERTLIEEGGLLLPPFVLQVSPSFRYTHQSSDELRIVQIGGVPTVTQQEVRRDSGEGSLSFRLGLPWDSQAEVVFPYVVTHEKVVTAQTIEESRSGHGLGDIEVGIAKQWLKEGEWLPNVLTAINWKSDTGETNFDSDDDDLSTGTGNQALQGAVTLTKSRDPLVFFGSIGYTHNFSHEVSGIDVDPGNSLDISFGAILAASPDTSLRAVQRQSFIGETAFDGEDFPGSDQVQATLEVGASTILLDNALFDVALGIGLTEDTPDYEVEASLPIRF